MNKGYRKILLLLFFIVIIIIIITDGNKDDGCLYALAKGYTLNINEANAFPDYCFLMHLIQIKTNSFSGVQWLVCIDAC